MEQLADKHPEAQRAKVGFVLFGPVEDVPTILWQQINGEMVREVALTTKINRWINRLLKRNTSQSED